MEEYENCPTKPEAPKLIDGGVYDNQGAHKLSHDKSRFHADYIIVSDAGNSSVSAARTTNFFNLAMTTISLMMDRVKKMQRADNLYETYVGKEHFAYVPLEWECGERLVHGFAKNLKEGNIHPDVWQAHAITEEEVSRLKGADENTPTGNRKHSTKCWNQSDCPFLAGNRESGSAFCLADRDASPPLLANAGCRKGMKVPRRNVRFVNTVSALCLFTFSFVA